MTTIVSIEPLGTFSDESGALFSATAPQSAPMPAPAAAPTTISLPAPLSEPLAENARLTIALDRALSDIRQLVSGALQQTTLPAPAAAETPVITESRPFPEESLLQNLLPTVQPPLSAAAEDGEPPSPVVVEASVRESADSTVAAQPVVEAPVRESADSTVVEAVVVAATPVREGADSTVAVARRMKTAETLEVSPDAAAAALTAAGIVPGAEIAIAAQRTSETVAPATPIAASAVSPEALPSQVLVETAQAVADTLIVTPGLMRGQGEVTVQLKNDVLQGSQVTIAVHGKQLEVAFLSASADVAALVERNLPQIQEFLGSRIHSFNVGVKLRKTRG